MKLFNNSSDIMDYILSLPPDEARSFIQRRAEAPNKVYPHTADDTTSIDATLETLANARRAGG